jgi:hypothetical protein
MFKLTFKNQIILGIIFIVLGFICSTIFKQGIFSNIGWILYGALFVFHPVLPKNAKSSSKALLVMRITGLVIIILGIITRFGV